MFWPGTTFIAPAGSGPIGNQRMKIPRVAVAIVAGGRNGLGEALAFTPKMIREINIGERR
jgi:hypothetical protein